MGDIELNKNLYPEVKYIKGPYLTKEGRLIIVCVKHDNTKTSISYPKYLKELELNRRLLNNETVDHIDQNPLNNDLDNLRVINRSQHASNDAKRIYGDSIVVYCQYCGNRIPFLNSRSFSYLNRRNTGYFCSKKCVGKYGSEIQRGLRKKVKVDKIKPIYYDNHSQYETYDWKNSKEFSISDLLIDFIFSIFK